MTAASKPAVITNAAGADIAADIIALKAETVLIVADSNELQTDWVNGGRLDLLIDAILLDTGTTLDGKLDTIDDFLDTEIAAILVDTGTTLENHLIDIKGTGFVKDTHSLIDIETFVDLIDDGTSGLAKIAADVAATLVDTTGLNGDAMRGTDNAALASVLGALADVAAADEVTSADTLIQYVKQLINILVGAAGIVTLKAAAAPASGVSLSEMVRAIYDDSNEIQGKLPTNKFMGSSDGADDDGTLNNIKTVTDKFDSAQAEPGQGAPAVNETPLVKLAHLYKQWRNKSDNDGTTVQLYNDGGGTVDHKRTVSEAAGTVTKGEVATGP